MTTITYYPTNREPEAAEREWNEYLIAQGWTQVKSGRFFKPSNELGHRFIKDYFHYKHVDGRPVECVEYITAEY